MPLGEAEVVQSGDDITLISYGAMMRPTLEAAETLAEEEPATEEPAEKEEAEPAEPTPVQQPAAAPELPDFSRWGEVARQPLRSVRRRG